MKFIEYVNILTIIANVIIVVLNYLNNEKIKKMNKELEEKIRG